MSLECAFFGVPTVVLYKLSWAEFEVAKRIVKVKHIAMPNLLAGREIYPEFIQGRATAENLSRAGLDFSRTNRGERRSARPRRKRLRHSEAPARHCAPRKPSWPRCGQDDGTGH